MGVPILRRRVRDVMTSSVHAVSPATTFKVIARTMEDNRVGALPVVDAGRVVGIVSLADLVPRLELGDAPAPAGVEGPARGRGGRPPSPATTAGELMTTPAVTISADAPVSEAARMMRVGTLRRLPVVDERDRLVGIVSRSDLVRLFLRDDEDIREDVLTRVVPRAVFDEDARHLKVDVVGGVITLRGQVLRRSDAELLVGLAHQVDGVVGVDASALHASLDDLEKVGHRGRRAHA